MDHERTPADETRDLGGLLVAFVLVGLPIGGTVAAVAGPAGYPFGLSMTETMLVTGAVPIALAEATGNRPDAVQSVAFFVAFGVGQISTVLVLALLFVGPTPWALTHLFPLLGAYGLAIRWGPAETARRLRAGLGRLTWIPGEEPPTDRR
ncbi:hypothetical protein C475_13927 [Halosimplex carlsbadense 2-9-1]|uniref:Uncharacterized protein n=1 Tax=Halosimplex carlsbadense 2-9-1 TaxID=797114 RepID=M0CNY4_9EURY|nr:hypothetical protein [Halosimplex carlsbadense]ELZ24353.1 hypothetical protein C475_13927 [Halosimplex carlsbadense 2-9-1]